MSWADAAREGRWADFEGLPDELDMASLLAGLGRQPSWTERPDVLGDDERTLAESEGLRCWLDGARVMLAELSDPASAAAADPMLAQRGAADGERPGRPRSDATVTDYVYAGRGLVLTVAESYDHPPSFEPFVVTVRLFAPTTLIAYLTELGGFERRRSRF